MKLLETLKFLNSHRFEFLFGLCLLFLLLFGLYKKITNKKGTWSSSFVYFPRYETMLKTPNKNNSKKTDSKGEIECRRVLEKIFGKSFSKSRPDFLRNPVTGNSFNLELDCYCPELKLAVEYNGIQHYKYTPYFHKNKDAFTNQKYRDYIKKEKCLQNGILLIDVPYSVKIKDIENFLINKLKKNNFI